MDLQLTEEQNMIRDAARDFAQNEIGISDQAKMQEVVGLSLLLQNDRPRG